jgi:hypothetical protein
MQQDFPNYCRFEEAELVQGGTIPLGTLQGD